LFLQVDEVTQSLEELSFETRTELEIKIDRLKLIWQAKYVKVDARVQALRICQLFFREHKCTTADGGSETDEKTEVANNNDELGNEFETIISLLENFRQSKNFIPIADKKKIINFLSKLRGLCGKNSKFEKKYVESRTRHISRDKDKKRTSYCDFVTHNNSLVPFVESVLKKVCGNEAVSFVVGDPEEKIVFYTDDVEKFKAKMASIINVEGLSNNWNTEAVFDYQYASTCSAIRNIQEECDTEKIPEGNAWSFRSSLAW
jgi:hypothetical protein